MQSRFNILIHIVKPMYTEAAGTEPTPREKVVHVSFYMIINVSSLMDSSL